jgi:uncharacterized repeat protein (TIGR01451 family)
LNTIVSDSATAGGRFVPGSVRVGGVPFPAGDIVAGVNNGTIVAGATVIVTFQTDIIFVPEPFGIITDFATVRFTEGGVPREAISNEVSIQASQTIITAVKRSLQSFAFVGDIVNYEARVINDGNFNALATWFDILPEGTSFVENSVTVNGVPSPGANKFTGLVLGTMEARLVNIVTFQLRVEFYPSTGILVNQGNMVFEFILPDGRTFRESEPTNPVTVIVLAPPTVVKTASVSEVFVGGTVTFTITVSNPGTTPFDKVVLTDNLPAGLSLVPGSVTVRGAASPGSDPALGVLIGLIAAQSSAQVSFTARADREPEIPLVVNSASIVFEYVAPNGERVPGIAKSNPVNVLISEDEE